MGTPSYRPARAPGEKIRLIRSHPAEAPAIEHGFEHDHEHGRRTVTYGELGRLVDERAALLRAHGGGDGTLVAVRRPKSVGYLVDFLAVFAIGGVAVPLDPELPADRSATFIELAGHSCCLTSPM
ncbi:MAG TPA: AMP-binding protein [Candidatus Limnocylindrales bacterium]